MTAVVDRREAGTPRKIVEASSLPLNRGEGLRLGFGISGEDVFVYTASDGRTSVGCAVRERRPKPGVLRGCGTNRKSTKCGSFSNSRIPNALEVSMISATRITGRCSALVGVAADHGGESTLLSVSKRIGVLWSATSNSRVTP